MTISFGHLNIVAYQSFPSNSLNGVASTSCHCGTLVQYIVKVSFFIKIIKSNFG